MRHPIPFAIALFVLAIAPGAHAQEEAAPPPPPPAATAPGAPLRQIQMHVWISETTEQGVRDLGANLTYTRFRDGVENPNDSLQQVNTNVFDPRDQNFTVTLPAPDQALFNPPLRPDQSGNPTDGIQTQSGAGLTFSLFKDDHGTIEGIFRSIERKADVDLISKPEVLVIEGKPAIIQAGGQVPFQSIAYDNKGNAQLNVAFKDIGVNINITPAAVSEDLIKLNINQLEVTDLARIDNIRGVDLPVISKRSQTGEVLVPDGQALGIGGLTSRIVRKSERRVPIIGRIPLLGIPFRGRTSEVSTTRLIIFVAPTLLDLRDLKPAGISALRFWQEDQWRNRERIDEEIHILESK